MAPSKLTHIVIKYSYVFPLIEADRKLLTEITFGGIMASKIMTLKPFSYQENNIVSAYF